MKYSFSAGGVVVNTNNQVYLIHKISRNEWALPKGRIEKRESKLDAAKREVGEETGISDLIVLFNDTIDNFEYIINRGDGIEAETKTVYMFLFKTNDKNQKGTIQMQEEGLEGKWFDFEEAANITKVDNVKNTLSKAVNKLKELY